MLLDLIIRCTNSHVRQDFSDLILEILMRLRENADIEVYGVVNSDGDFDGEYPFSGRAPAIRRVARTCAKNFINLKLNLRTWDNFFSLLTKIAGLGVGEVAALLERGLLRTCLEFLIHPSSEPFNRSADWKHFCSLKQKRKLPLNKMIEFVHMMLDSIDFKPPPLDEDEDQIESFDPATSKFSITVMDEEVLTLWDDRDQDLYLMAKIFDAWDYSPNETCVPSQILAMVMKRSPQLTAKHFFHTLKNGLEGLETVNYQPFYDGAAMFCTVCKSTKFVADLFEHCTHQALAGETGATSAYLLRFLETLSRSENHKLGKNYLLGMLLNDARYWGTGLLFNGDSVVRQGAYQLLTQLIIEQESSEADDQPSEIDKSRVQALRYLIVDVSNRLRRYFDGSYAGKQFLLQGVSMVVDGASWLQELNKSEKEADIALHHSNDASLITKVDELHLEWERWPHEDSEVAASEDEWPSDAGFVSDPDDVMET